MRSGNPAYEYEDRFPNPDRQDGTGADNRWWKWALDQEPFDPEPRVRRRKAGPARIGWRWIIALLGCLAIVVLLVVTAVEIAIGAEPPHPVPGIDKAREAAVVRQESSRGGWR